MNSGAPFVWMDRFLDTTREGPRWLAKEEIASMVEEGPPFSARINACPFLLCQKPIVAVSSPVTGVGEIVTPLSLPSNDRFRILVSRLAASCLDILKRSSSFAECLSDCPEFAQDVVKNLAQAKPLELDANGELEE